MCLNLTFYRNAVEIQKSVYYVTLGEVYNRVCGMRNKMERQYNNNNNEQTLA